MKAYQGMYVRNFNSVDNIARELTDAYFNDASYFDLGHVYEKLDISYTNKVISEVLSNQTALSVINPQ